MQDVLFSVFPNENFVDLGLFQFGKEQCAPAHSFGPATRNHFLFHYVLSGTGILYADNAKGETIPHHIRSMQGFMIFPGQINTYIADSHMPWEYVWLEFDGLRVKSMLEMAGFSQDTPIYHARKKELREEMRKEMLYIVEHANESAFHLIGHLYLFLDYLTRSIAPIRVKASSTLRDFYLHEAIEYIEHNFQNAITVEDIAAVCGLNRTYFGKIFKQTTGKTPQNFLLQYRMTKATELLLLTELSVHDISNAVGYENALHFSRAFKTVYGVPPREWRNQNRVRAEKIQTIDTV